MARIHNREQAQRDTMYWCQLIKTASGLGDQAIEEKLFDGVAATGRRFNRWLKGQNVMTPDTLQQLCENAVRAGWLKRPSGLILSSNVRAGFVHRSKKKWSSEVIAEHNAKVSRLHKTHAEAIAKLAELRALLRTTPDVLLIRPSKPDDDQGNELVERDVKEMVNVLKNVHFMDLSPWAEVA